MVVYEGETFVVCLASEDKLAEVWLRAMLADEIVYLDALSFSQINFMTFREINHWR